MEIKLFTEQNLENIGNQITSTFSVDNKAIGWGLLALAYSIHEFAQVVTIASEKYLEYQKDKDSSPL